MSISAIPAAPALSPLRFNPVLPSAVPKSGGPGFGEMLGGAVKDLAKAQNNASQTARAFELGKESDLASVMVTQQVSSLGFQLAVNVRNKALGAYRDIMNMPV